MKPKLHFLFMCALLLQIGAAPLTLNQPGDPPPPRQRVYPPGAEALLPIGEQELLFQPGGESSETPVASPEMETSINWERGVVASYRDGDWEIYSLVNMNFSQTMVRLTNRNGRDYQPRLSRDAQKIVFTSERTGDFEICVMDWGGANVICLTSSSGYDGEAVWAPDGTRLAFVSERSGGSEIYVMGSDGANPTQLSYTGGNVFAPAWSPDGTKIAFIQAVSASEGVIKTMNPDGSGLATVSSPLRYVLGLDWSPEGRRLAINYDSNADNWLELGVLGVPTGVVTQVGPLGTLKDAYLGSWDNSGAYLYYNKLLYTIISGEYYVKSARLTFLTVGSGAESFYTTSIYDFSSDTECLDHTVPTSYVKPLPTYTRFGGFNVYWAGYDSGPSLLCCIGVQSLSSLTNTWWDWFQNTALPNELFPYGQPGETFYFRSRARDNADNLEAWPEGDGDTFTTLYRNELSGRVQDARGAGIPGANLSVTPTGVNPLASSSPDGSFLSYTIEEGAHSLQAAHSGYGALPAVPVNMVADQQAFVLLPPADNLLTNSGFESPGDPLNGWQVSGSLPVSYTAGHSGIAAHLGYLCTPPCLAAASPPETTLPTDHSDLAFAADKQGSLHLLYGHHWYSKRSPAGVWSAPEELPGFAGIPIEGDRDPALAVEDGGTLHALIRSSTDLLYLQKPPGGSWSTPFSLGKGHSPEAAIDGSGNLHIVYYNTWYESGEDAITYRSRSAAGIWNDPRSVNPSNGAFDIAAGPDNSAHILMRLNSGYLLADWWVHPDGLTTYHHIIHYETSYPRIVQPSIQIDASGKLHLADSDGTTLRYWSMDSPENVSPPTKIFYPAYRLNLALGLDGSVVIAADTYDDYYSERVRVHYKPVQAKQFISGWVETAVQYPEGLDLAVDTAGDLHLAFTDSYYLSYFTLPRAQTAEQARLQTSLDIPADLHKPTLSLLHSLDAWAPVVDLSFQLSVQSPISQAVLLETGELTEWSHSWFDLSAWQGEHVTLTLELEQAAGEPYVRLRLDELSLGSWLTPRITSLNPSHVPSQNSVLVTISGENFIDTPSVSIGGQPLSPVNFVDEFTLTALLPAGIPPGVYPLTVINPSGQQAVYQAMVFGEHLYLPLVEMKGLP